jgi:hypothetical protein
MTRDQLRKTLAGDSFYNNTGATRIDRAAEVGTGEASWDQAKVGVGRLYAGLAGLAFAGGFIDEDTFADISASQATVDKLGKVTPAYKKLIESETATDVIKNALESPTSLIPLSASSIATLIPAAAAGAATAFVTKNPKLSLAAANIAGGVGGEGPLEFMGQIQERISEMGLDPTNPESWRVVGKDKNLLLESAQRAGVKGAVIGSVGAGFAQAAGVPYKAFQKPLGMAIRSGVAKPTSGTIENFLRKTAGASGDVALQMGGEGVGEAASQVAIGDSIDMKEVVLESLASGPMSIAESSVGIFTGRNKGAKQVAPNTIEALRRFDERMAKVGRPAQDPIQMYMADLRDNKDFSVTSDESSDTLVLKKEALDKFIQEKIEKEGADTVSEYQKVSDYINTLLIPEVPKNDGGVSEKEPDSKTQGKPETPVEVDVVDVVDVVDDAEQTPAEFKSPLGNLTSVENSAEEIALAQETAEVAGKDFFTDEEIAEIKKVAPPQKKAEPEDTPDVPEVPDNAAIALERIAKNTASKEDAALAASEGLVDFVNNKIVITDEGADRMALAGFERPALTERERRVQIATQSQKGSTTVDMSRPVQEVPIERIKTSSEVKQFKKGADAKTGVVEPLGGKYMRDPLQPIMLWERNDGTREIVSGRHRLDLAKRSGEKSIPAQVWKESDGFTAKDMSNLDATANIRDGQGSISDYARFFRESKMTKEDAQNAGLLARVKGKSGFEIGINGTDALFDALVNDKISEKKASLIASSAPNNESVQRALISRNIPDESIPAWAAIATNKTNTQQGEMQTDLFGADDSAMQELDFIANEASKIVRDIGEDISAISGAARRPERAKKLGVDLKNRKEVNAKLKELKSLQERYKNLAGNPDLVKEILEGRKADTPAKKTKEPAKEPAKKADTPKENKPAAKAKNVENMTVAELGEFLEDARQKIKTLSDNPREAARLQNQIDDARIFLKEKQKTGLTAILEQVEEQEAGEYVPTDKERAEMEADLNSEDVNSKRIPAEAPLAPVEGIKDFDSLPDEVKKKITLATRDVVMPKKGSVFSGSTASENSLPLTPTEIQHINELNDIGLFGENPAETVISKMLESKNALYRVLAKAMQSAIKTGWKPNVSFEVKRLPTVNAYGAYSPKNNTIYINLSYISPNGVLDTVAHEVAHSFTLAKVKDALKMPADSLAGKAIADIKNVIKETRKLAKASPNKIDSRSLNGLGDLDSKTVSNNEVVEFLNDILILPELQKLVSEVKITGDSAKGNVLQKVLRRILEVITGRSIALDSALFKSYDTAYNFVVKTPFEKGMMESLDGAVVESKILNDSKNKIVAALKSKIGGISIIPDNVVPEYRPTGWFGAGLFDKTVNNIFSAVSRRKASLMRGVESAANRLEKSIIDNKLDPAVVLTALGNLENNITQDQENNIKILAEENTSNSLDAVIQQLRATSPEADAKIQAEFAANPDAKRKNVLKKVMSAKDYQVLKKTLDDIYNDTIESETAAVKKESLDMFKQRQIEAFNSLPAETQSIITEARKDIEQKSNILKRFVDESKQDVINENLNSYLNRAYAIFDDPDWAKKIVKNKPVVEAAKQTIADYIAKEKATKTVVKSIKNGQRVDYSDALEIAKSEVTAEQVDKVFLSLLSAGDIFAKQQGTGSSLKIAQGIMKQRGGIDPSIQALMGVYKNAPKVYARTSAKMTNFIAKSEALEKVYAKGIKEGYVKDERQPGYVKVADDVRWGDLAGKYIPQELFMGIEAFNEANENIPAWLGLMMKATGYSMMTKTVLSAVTQVRNFWSNYAAVMASGNLLRNPAAFQAELSDAFKVIKERFQTDIQGKKEGNFEPFIREMIEIGVLDDQIDIGVMNSLLNENPNNETFLDNFFQKNAAGKLIKKGKDIAQFSYSNVDGMFKIAVWNMERKKAIEIRGMSPEKSSRYAGEIVRDVMWTYSNVPSVIKELKRFPFVAPFISFTSEVIRTTYNIQKLGIAEIKEGKAAGNEALVKSGIDRLIGLSTALTLPAALAGTVALALGISADDDEAVRAFLPEWQKGNTLIYLGKPKDGKVNFIDLSFLMPHNIITDPFTSAFDKIMNADSLGEAAIEGPAQMLRTFLSPFVSPQILSNAVIEASVNKTSSGGRVYNEALTDGEKTVAITKHILRAFEPGTVASIGRITSAATGNVTDTGRSFELFNEIGSLVFGQRISSLDAAQAIRFKASEFNSLNRDATNLFTRNFATQGTRNNEQILAAYQQSQEARVRVYSKMVQQYNQALALGVPQREVNKILAGNGMSGTVIKNIANNRMERYEPSTALINAAKSVDRNRLGVLKEMRKGPKYIEIP